MKRSDSVECPNNQKGRRGGDQDDLTLGQGKSVHARSFALTLTVQRCKSDRKRAWLVFYQEG